MSKCEAKVKKIVPRRFFWGTSEVFEECPNDAKGLGRYCEEHGCFDCSLRPKEFCSKFGEVDLCLVCRGRRIIDKEKLEEEAEELAKKAREDDERERIKKELENLEQERGDYAKKVIELAG
jgi:hypothetical protein